MTPAPRWRLQSFAVLDSTQDLCRRLAEAGEPGHLAVLAGRQTQARGTHGRGWESHSGNLALSVLLRPDAGARDAGQWALLAAVALAETVAAVLPRETPPRLKWPNDLLLDGRKLAGILTESVARPDGRLDWLVIGFGVNLAVAPDVAGRETACVAQAAPPPAPDRFAHNLLACLDAWVGRLLSDGFAPVRAAWLGYAPAPGSPVTLRLSERTVAGTFSGLHDDGRLLLSTEGQTRAFAAGET